MTSKQVDKLTSCCQLWQLLVNHFKVLLSSRLITMFIIHTKYSIFYQLVNLSTRQLNQYKNVMIRYPTPMLTNVVMNPDSWKEWLSTYLPIRVVPVRSKLMAATSVG